MFRTETVHVKLCECGYNILLRLKDSSPSEVRLGVLDRLNVPAEDESVESAREEVTRYTGGSRVVVHPGDAAHHPLVTLKGL